MQWREFIVESDTWEKEKDLENVKKVIVEFEERLSVKLI